MSDNDVYFLSHCINLAGSEDSVLIPLFRRPFSNYTYVSRTDSMMNIMSFDEIMSFDQLICHISDDACEKIEYVVGDVCPVIAKGEGQIFVFSGDYVEDIISKIKEQPACSKISAYAVELLNDIISTSPSTRRHPRKEEVDDHLLMFDKLIRPTPSRLWLENVIRSADPRVFPSIKDKFTATEEIRLSLLAWAHEIFSGATTQVKKYFLSALSTSEMHGVYVEDIYAAFIISEATSSCYNSNVIDLARNHRKKFNRGPLTSLLTLTSNQSGPFHHRANGLIEPFFNKMEFSIEHSHGKEALGLSFFADHPNQWPHRIISICNDRFDTAFDYLNREINGFDECVKLLQITDHRKLLSEMKNRNFLDIKASRLNKMSLYNIDPLTRLKAGIFAKLSSYRSSIIDAVGYLDFLRKLVTASEYNRSFASRSTINYESLGLDRAWVARYVMADVKHI